MSESVVSESNANKSKLSGHEKLCIDFEEDLKNLLEGDQYLNDLSYDCQPEEILAQIALVKGQSITVYINRLELPEFEIVIPEKGTTLIKLKKSIQQYYEREEKRKLNRLKRSKVPSYSVRKLLAGSKKISWRYIWRTYYLAHASRPLLDDYKLLADYGIKNKSVLKFKKRITLNQRNKKSKT